MLTFAVDSAAVALGVVSAALFRYRYPQGLKYLENGYENE